MLIKEITKEEAWRIRQVVMWPDKPLDFIKLKDDDRGLHYGVFENDALTSVVSVFVHQEEMQFRKLATLTEKQGRGLGTFLMEFVITLATQKHLKRLWCNARASKASFYHKFGFQETGTYFVKDGVEFTIMELLL